MRRWMVLLIAVAALAPAAHAGSKAREISRSFALDKDQILRLDLSVGEIRIEGADIDKVEAELRIECRWGNDEDCDRLLEQGRPGLAHDVAAPHHRDRQRLELAQDQARDRRRVPRPAWRRPGGRHGRRRADHRRVSRPIVSADLGVGELTIRMAAAAVRSVGLDAGVGEAKLLGAGSFVEGRRSMLVGSEVFWDEGEGEARVRADVGVGEATVYLE